MNIDNDLIVPKESGLVFTIGDSESTAIGKAENVEGKCAGNDDEVASGRAVWVSEATSVN